MNLRSILPLSLALSLSFIGCGRRMIAPESGRKDCAARVEENAFVPGAEPASILKGDKSSGPWCYSEEGLKLHAKDLACDSGFALVSLVSIETPGFWSSPCFRADLEFYKSADSVKVAEAPIMRYDSVRVKGVQVQFRMDIGSVVDGAQRESGLVSEKGDTARTSKMGFYLGLRYYPLSFFGFEAETGGLFGSATAKDTKSMSFTRAWSSNLGVSLIPWQKKLLRSRLQAALSGGASYVRLAFADEYKDFVEQNTGVVFYDDAASGFGWYAGGAFRILSKTGYVSELGIHYSQEYPMFPKGTKAFTAANVFLDLSLGYAF
jgi:hypothetical protein